jgi:hypothetical protein
MECRVYNFLFKKIQCSLKILNWCNNQMDLITQRNINVKIITNSNQQTQSYEFTSHIAAFLSVVLITEMLEICIQTSNDQNVQLILKSYLPVVYGTPLNLLAVSVLFLIFRSNFTWSLWYHLKCQLSIK